MKNSLTYAGLALMTGAVVCYPFRSLNAAETNTAVASTTAAQSVVVAGTPVEVSSGAVKLPYGVEDVLKLSRANINDDIILNYVQSSGTIYNLTPQDIVYLRNQGVSDRVVNAMVGQRKLVEATAQGPQQVPAPAPNAPMIQDPGVAVDPTYSDVGSGYTEAPATSAPSSVYVIPYPQATAAYYGYYGYSPYSYYGPYAYGYCAPSVSIGIGFGGYGYYGHGYYGHRYYGHGGYGHGGYGHGGHGWHH